MNSDSFFDTPPISLPLVGNLASPADSIHMPVDSYAALPAHPQVRCRTFLVHRRLLDSRGTTYVTDALFVLVPIRTLMDAWDVVVLAREAFARYHCQGISAGSAQTLTK
jgi:hypothetical protein